MNLTRDTILQNRYDVIVVGSGLSSLTAAALLAKRGLQTLLIEHHYLPGGMCTTLRRQGFSFDTGTALVYGFGERGFNPFRYLMNELEEEIDVIAHKALFRMSFEGKQVTFWPDIERFLDELTRVFPSQRSQLYSLYSYLQDRYANVIADEPVIVPPTEMPQSENLKKLLRHPGAMLSTLKMLNTSTESVLAKFITDLGLMAFFDKLTSTYCYCTVAETPAILAATMFVDNHIGGAFYPARSPQILASKLEKAFEGFGGQTLYRRQVDEIVIERNAATGVRLTDGTRINAHCVVSGATVWNLYGNLIRPEHIRPERLAWAKGLVPTYASVVLYIGVDAEAIPQGTLPVEILIADMEGVNRGDLTLYISSLDDPSICPPGTHAVTVIAPTMESWPGPYSKEYHSAEYGKRKQAEADRLLEQIERHFPGFRQHIRVMEIGTPATIERYTLKNGGAVGGPKQSIGQELMKRLHARSDWKDLYLCGDSTVMGMGAPAVAVSGVGAANCLLRDLKLPEYKLHDFARQYVHITNGAPLPPLPAAGEPIHAEAARRLARECEYCEKPGCTAACPAGIDLANAMRKIEAGNVAGAARTFREMNPLAEVCGYLCLPNPPCEAKCNRLSFSNRPVRIAGLQAWVCRAAGDTGWPGLHVTPNGRRIAVVGAGPAGLACAYFLGITGHEVDLYDRLTAPGGTLLDVSSAQMPHSTVTRDVEGAIRTGVTFKPGDVLGSNLHLEKLLRGYRAVFLATGKASRAAVTPIVSTAGIHLNPETMAVREVRDALFAGGSLIRDECSVVQAVADGRRAAMGIDARLREP